MKRSLAFALFALTATLVLSAQVLTVSWADGKVELQRGASWAALNIGDKVDAGTAVLRLGASSSVELSGGQRRISITSAGQFTLATILKQATDSAKPRTAVIDKVGKLVDPKGAEQQAMVGGVRGAAVEPTTESVTWMTDTIDVPATMEEGRVFARSGDFAGAASKFAEAAGAAEGADLDAARYALAWALANDGSFARAVKILRELPATGPWGAPRALLLARLDLDSSAKPEAKAVLLAAKAAKLFVGDDVALAEALLAEASN